MTEKEESMKLLISEGRHSFMNVQRPISCAGKTTKTPLSRRKRALSSEAGYLHISLHNTSINPLSPAVLRTVTDKDKSLLLALGKLSQCMEVGGQEAFCYKVKIDS